MIVTRIIKAYIAIHNLNHNLDISLAYSVHFCQLSPAYSSSLPLPELEVCNWPGEKLGFGLSLLDNPSLEEKRSDRDAHAAM
jgi:hypothetical protein